MNQPRIIIVAAGNSKRWNDYGGIPKHLVPIENVPLIHRTINQLMQAGMTDLVLVAYDDRYGTCRLVVTKPTESILPDTGIGHSYAHWCYTGRTIVIFGDVVFSNEAISILLKEHPSNDVMWYGRLGASTTTGHAWKEMFAMSFWPTNIPALLRRIEIVRTLKEKDKKMMGAAWPLHSLQAFGSAGRWERSKWLIEIDDLTDDMDTPDDYAEWKRRTGL